MEELKIILPSKIRARILDDHKMLRQMLAELADRLTDCIERDGVTFEFVKSKTVDLLRILKSHMQLEDEILYPFLKTVDSWGAIRSQKFHDEHLKQSKFIEKLEETLYNPILNRLDAVDGIEEFTDWLLKDMADEERDFLDEKLLKDDLTNLDYFGG